MDTTGGRMVTRDEIQEQLERSIGREPALGSVEDLLAQGHRALARRRIAAGVAAAAVVAVVGGTSFVAWGGTGAGARPGAGFAGSGTAGPRVSTSAAPAASASPPTRAEVARTLRRALARYDDHGALVIDPRATVVRRIDDPYALTGSGRSVALVLEVGGTTYWYALHWSPGGLVGSTGAWSGDFPEETFDAWVQDHRIIARPDPGSKSGDWPGVPDDSLVRFGAGERLRPLAGVRILEQRPHVSVGASFAGPGDRTAAALVEAADGTRSYVLARGTGGGAAQYIAVAAADGGPSLDAFLELARARYAEGGGGLL